MSKRFWSKVDKYGDCWEWTAARMNGGYGVFWRDSAQRYAHRESWEMANGTIPEGMFVCHRCDNPGCVNPAHMFLGTHRDNVQDMVAKGRHSFGSKNGEAKLDEFDVWLIRHAYELLPVSQRDIAKAWGVSQRQVGRVVRGLSW